MTSRLLRALPLFLLAAPPHSLLVGSEPGRNATVTRAPERVKLWFGERIEPASAKLSFWTVSTPPLGPRRCTVRFRVLSVDGHVVESSFAFTVTVKAAFL